MSVTDCTPGRVACARNRAPNGKRQRKKPERQPLFGLPAQPNAAMPAPADNHRVADRAQEKGCAAPSPAAPAARASAAHGAVAALREARCCQRRRTAAAATLLTSHIDHPRPLTYLAWARLHRLSSPAPVSRSQCAREQHHRRQGGRRCCAHQPGASRHGQDDFVAAG